MIKLQLDEAFCIDLLSIAEVKFKKTKKQSAEDNFLIIKNQIVEQIGNEVTSSILSSEEYKAMYDCNAKIFDLIDDIKIYPNMLASVVDNQNYRRFELKKSLQEKFFPEKNLGEQKFGYKSF